MAGESLPLSDLEWLLLHHEAKKDERREMVRTLPLKAGQRVLDAGCGPGLWSKLLAPEISPGGTIVGIDIHYPHLEFCRREGAISTSGTKGHFMLADFQDLPFPQASFDAVFFSNCFAYLPRPGSALRKLLRMCRQGGYVIGRHFDNTFFLINPVPTSLQVEVLRAANIALERDPFPHPFRNSFGQQMHGLFRTVELSGVTTQTFAIQRVQPLSPAEEHYIRQTANWYGTIAARVLERSVTRRWRSYFDPSSDRYVLRSSELYFCMIEMLTLGQRGQPTPYKSGGA